MTINQTNNKITTKNDLLEGLFKDRTARIALAKQSHYWFFHLYFSNYIKYKTAPFQREIFSLTENQDLPLVAIIAFRGSAKSTIVTLSSVIWSIIGKPQKKYVVILTKTQQQARQHLANLKYELEGNKLLINDFGPFQVSDFEWTASSLILAKYQAKIVCASLETAIRGSRYMEYRPDLVIADDLEDDLSTKNKETREKTYNWFLREVIPLGDKGTKIVIVGNMLHPDSLLMRLAGEIKEDNRDGIFRRYPIIEGKKIYWPAKYPTEKDIDIEKRKISNEKAWNQEYLLNPLYDENYIIRPKMIKYYDSINENPDDFDYIAIGVDPAISDKDDSCYTGIVISKIYGNWDSLKIYILPNPINTKKEFPEIVEILKQLYKDFSKEGPVKIFVEGVAAQTYLVHQLNHEDIPAEGIQPKGDKEARLYVLSHRIQNGKILFPQEGAEELINQMIEFKNIKYKDLADAFTLVCNKVVEDDEKFVMPEIWFPDMDD